MSQYDFRKTATTRAAVAMVASRFLTTVAFLLIALLAGASTAQAEVVSYTLDDVFLIDGGQLTGAFDWTYTTGDFADGSGVFTALEIPRTPSGTAPPLEQEGMILTIENNQIEISLDGNFHDFGLDISLKFSMDPLSPTQSSPIDLSTSFYECCGNGFHDQPFSSGRISPVPTPATIPDIPVIQSVEPGDGELLVRFFVGNNGGAEVQSYTVTCGSESSSGTSSPIVVSSLNNDVEYSCSMVATNATGSSSPSSPVSGKPEESISGLNIAILKAAIDKKNQSER